MLPVCNVSRHKFVAIYLVLKSQFVCIFSLSRVVKIKDDSFKSVNAAIFLLLKLKDVSIVKRKWYMCIHYGNFSVLNQ